AGTVNSTAGMPSSVLTVNGSPGVVVVPASSPITIAVAAAPLGPATSPYVLWAWMGQSQNAQALSLGPDRIGCTVNPTPFAGGQGPQPFLCLHSSNVGNGPCGPARVLRSPASAPWSRTFAGPAGPRDFVLQGVIRDNGAANVRRVSVTNAVLLRIP